MKSVQLPRVNGLLITVQENAQRSFLMFPNDENFFCSFSLGMPKAFRVGQFFVVEVLGLSEC